MNDLEDRLIKLGSKRKDLRPHIRPLLAYLKLAGKTLYALINPRRNELLAATDNKHAMNRRYWGRELPNGRKIPSGATVAVLQGVPRGVANQLMLQGNDEKWYADPREAFQEAKPYIKDVVNDARAASRRRSEPANDKYERWMDEAMDHLKRIERSLKRHERRHGPPDANYATANDVGAVVDKLQWVAKDW